MKLTLTNILLEIISALILAFVASLVVGLVFGDIEFVDHEYTVTAYHDSGEIVGTWYTDHLELIGDTAYLSPEGYDERLILKDFELMIWSKEKEWITDVR